MRRWGKSKTEGWGGFFILDLGLWKRKRVRSWEDEKVGKSKIEGWGGRGKRGIRRTNSFMDW